MEEDDNKIYEESEKSDSDFLDGVDDPTYMPSNLSSHHSDTEARIQPLYLTDSGSESEKMRIISKFHRYHPMVYLLQHTFPQRLRTQALEL